MPKGLIVSGVLAFDGRQLLFGYDVYTPEVLVRMIRQTQEQTPSGRHWIEALGEPATLHTERRRDDWQK